MATVLGGLSQGIINPAQADVLGGFEQGRQRQSRDLAGQILGETFTGKLGALAQIDPEKGLALAEVLGIPADSKGRLNNLIGITVAANQLIDSGLTNEAIQFLDEEATKIEQTTGDSSAAQRLRGAQNALATGDQVGITGFKRFAEAVSPKKEERTTLQKNLEAAGLVSGSPEFREAVLANVNKPGTTINLGDTGLSEERKALAKGRVTQLTKFREERETAIDTNQSLDVLENIDVRTGALEPAKLGLASFAKAFGINAGGLANVAQGEAFNAEAKRIVLAVKASQKGPQTDKDEETIRDTVANLGNSREGNQFIIDSARALSNRRIGRADFFDAFLEEGETLKGANREWSRFKRDTPMVSSVMRTPQGLPVFFYKFEQAVRSANPDATKSEILEAWREANRKGAR